MTDSTRDYPSTREDLDANTLLDMVDADPGDEFWVPVSPIRSNKFRAAKVRVLDRVSVNNYEEHHALDKWPQSDRQPISHEWSDGNARINTQNSEPSEVTDI